MGMFQQLKQLGETTAALPGVISGAAELRDAVARMGQLSQTLQAQSAPVDEEAMVAADAVVVEVAATGVTVNDCPVVALSLLVTVQGGPPVSCTLRTPVTLVDLVRLQPGAQLAVRVDPTRPDQVRLAR